MDINIALTRAGIFIVVYALVLGVPFWLGYVTKSWLIATSFAVILATIGPFIYQSLRKRAEEVILKEQRRYQRALLDISRTMIRIRDLDRLLKAIVLTVVDTVKVDFAAIYLKDDEYKSLRLKHSYPKGMQSPFPESVPLNSSVTKILSEQKRPLTAEEIGSGMRQGGHSLVVPCFMEDDLLGFLCLGQKANKQMYTRDDIIVFETLSYSTSLAIENCRFWREIEDRQRKARLQEMDTYSYSLAHEIDNPMYIVMGQTELLKKEFLKDVTDGTKRKEIEESCDFILEAAKRVSGMVKAIRDFGSPATGELKPLKLTDVVESFSRLYYPQFKSAAVTYTQELPPLTIYIRGEKPELMQVFVILANNAVHAMKYVSAKQITLKTELSDHETVLITFQDSGYGIKHELLPIIFAPFTTTKASTEGTGMGLYNAAKIVARHKGTIKAESEGEGKGATFIIELPVVKDIEADTKTEDKSQRIF